MAEKLPFVISNRGYKKVLKKVELMPVEHMDDVLKEALILNEGEELFAPEEECIPFCLKDIPKDGDSSSSSLTAH